MTKRSAGTVPPPAPGARRTDRELLADLGLGERASHRDVESAHDRIVAFLETAPPELSSWARGAAGAADEAYALLADPTSRAAAAERDERAASGAPQEAVPADGEPPAAAPGFLAGLRENPRRRRIAIAAGVVAAIVAVVGVYEMGGDGSTSQESAQTATSAPSLAGQVDKNQVAQLMGRIAANPTSAAPLVQLGNLYFQAGDYASAAQWMGRAVKLRPASTTARLALGAAWFNLGRRKDAEREWLRVVATNPKNVEAHYDLGFLYLSAKPPDTARVREEWRRVVELAPKSDVAKTVAAHLGQLDKTSGTSTSGGK